MAEAKAWVMIPKSDKKATEIVIDMHPLILCKDCRFSYYASNRVPTEQAYSCSKHGLDVTRDWFCADGERKSTDEILMEEMDADPLG